MSRIVQTISVTAPIERVFGYFAALDRVPEWMPEDFAAVRPVTGDTPGAGARFRYTTTAGISGDWVVQEFDPPRVLAWHGPPARAGRLGAVEGRGRYEFRQDGPGTEVTVLVEPRFRGLLRLLAPVSAARIARKLPRQLERAKKQLEGDGARPAGSAPSANRRADDCRD
jgi:uncharacterized protein YndB with AHSA1/START domain